MSQQNLTWTISIDPTIAQNAIRGLVSTINTSSSQITTIIKTQSAAAIKAAKEQADAATRGAAQAAASQIQLHRTVGQHNQIAKQTIDDLGNHLNFFIGERLPLVGGAFIRISENLRSLHVSLKPVEGSLLNLGKAIAEISTKSGKSVTDVKGFLESFAKLGTTAQRDAATIDFFGASVAQKLTPQLNRASTEMEALASAGGQAGGGIGALAGPIGIAVVAIAALIAAGIALGVSLFEVAKKAADYGVELYKAQLVTGLTARTLSTLKVISAETGTSFDSLTSAAAKLQIGISKALTDKGSEAAKAMHLLTLNTEEFKNALPDKQLAMTAKAITELTNQSDKNRVSNALTGKGYKESAAALKEFGDNAEEAQRKADEFGLSLSQGDLEAAHKFEVAMKDAELVVEGFGLRVGTWLVPTVTGAMNDISATLTGNTGGWASWADFIGEILSGLVNRVRVYAARIAADIKSLPAQLALVARGRFGEALAFESAVVNQAEKNKQFEIFKESISGGAGNVVPAGPSFPGGGGKKAAKDTQAQDEFEAEKKAIEERENAYREETERLKHEYELRHIAFEQYIQGERDANALRLSGILDEIDKEQGALDTALANKKIKQEDYDKKNAELSDQTKKAVRENKKEENRIDDEDYKSRLKALEEFNARKLELDKAAADISLAAIKDAESQETKSHHDAAVARNDIEQGLLTQRRDNLRAESKIAREGSDEWKRINQQILLLAKEQEAFDAEAARRSRDGRQQDVDEDRKRYQQRLDNLRNYLDAYSRLALTGLAIEEEISRLRVDILRASRASQLQIVNAEIALREDAENKQHAQELSRIESEYQKTLDAAKKTERSWQQMVTALRKRNQDIEAETKRHDKQTELEAKLAARSRALAGKGGGFALGIDTGQLKTLTDGVRNFQDVATVAFSAVGAVVNGLAQGVGQLVQNWVLMGNQADVSMQKMLASVLASVASQAAVQAVLFTAYGIAALTPWGAAIYGPAPAWFEAAALMAGIAVTTGLAGRAVAGSSFQQKPATSSGTSSGASNNSTSSPSPITLGSQRQMMEHKVTVTIKAPAGFSADAIVEALRNNHTELTTQIQGAAARGNG